MVDSIDESPQPSQALLEQSVANWVNAWESQSLDAYFASYHPDFVPRNQDSVVAWKQNRERVIGRAQWIKLAMSDFEVVGQQGDTIEVQCWLGYESPTYRDKTLKKLLLREAEGVWLIVEEVNLEVRI